MDSIDRKILTQISKSLPLDERPYARIAETLGLSEQDVICRLRNLHETGLIRRIGAVINPRRIGWHSTLCACDVADEMLHLYAGTVNSYPEVTHNYIRSGKPNCWFTLITPDIQTSRRIISEIEESLGVKVLDLPASRIFKINVSFNFD